MRSSRPPVTTLFHGQERHLATEPSLWPAQLYGTVYQQQFVKLTACIRFGASSKHICLLYVLMVDWLTDFINFCNAFPARCRPNREGITTSTYLLTYLQIITKNEAFPLLAALYAWNGPIYVKPRSKTKKTTAYTRYHGVELGQVSCGKQTFRCGI